MKALSVIIVGVWISLSEFLRNEILFKSHWMEHYKALGLVFPSEPVNGAVWGVWSMCYALAVFFICNKYNLGASVLISWFIGFVLMWLVIGNMGALPFGLLAFAIPLSLLESALACVIITKLGLKK